MEEYEALANRQDCELQLRKAFLDPKLSARMLGKYDGCIGVQDRVPSKKLFNTGVCYLPWAILKN